jgi:hypothetical protein
VQDPDPDAAIEVLESLMNIALNGTICSPPDTSDDPFFGNDPERASAPGGSMFDVEALKCSECRSAWRKAVKALGGRATGSRAVRYTFEPYRPDGSPRKTVGTHRLPYAAAFLAATGGTGYMPTYNQAAFKEQWMLGEHDRVLYELEDGEDEA